MPSKRTNRKRRVLKKRIRDAAQVIQDNIAGQVVGRPPEYHPGFCHLAERTCITNSATNPELAKLFGVSHSVIAHWEKEYPEFLEAVKRGKALADAGVEAALVHRAKGYSHQSEKIFMTKKGRIVRANTTEHYPPDPTSAIFWLKNRQPQHFRPDTHLTPGDGSTPNDLAQQLRNQLAEIDKSTGGT